MDGPDDKPTTPDPTKLADELERLHSEARGCEFDLVPADGPIARLALFMHRNGDDIVSALRSPTPPHDVAKMREALTNPKLDDREKVQVALAALTRPSATPAAVGPVGWRWRFHEDAEPWFHGDTVPGFVEAHPERWVAEPLFTRPTPAAVNPVVERVCPSCRVRGGLRCDECYQREAAALTPRQSAPVEQLVDDEVTALTIIQHAFEEAGVQRPFFGEAYEPGTVVASIVRQVSALRSDSGGVGGEKREIVASLIRGTGATDEAADDAADRIMAYLLAGQRGEREAGEANDWLEWTRFEGPPPSSDEIKAAHEKVRRALATKEQGR